MLIPCVECGKKDYTEESPLWYHCNKCLHPKTKNHCLFCGQETSNKTLCTACNTIKELHEHYNRYMRHCDGCGQDYPNSHLDYIEVYDGYFCNRCAE